MTIILRRPWTRQPQIGQPAANFLNGGELFHCNGAAIVESVARNLPTSINTLSRTTGFSQFGVDTLLNGSDAALVSSQVVTPPQNITIFAVARVMANWGGETANTNTIGGFVFSNNGSNLIRGGDACFSMHGFLEYFGNKPNGVSITYDDGTTESVYLAGGSSANRDTWFLSAAYAHQSEVRLYARNLATGQEFSSASARTKALKRAPQRFNVLSAAPNGNSNWAAIAVSRAASVAGWVPRAWTINQMRAVAQNPGQLFAPRQIIIPTSAAPSGASTLNDLKAASITSNSVQFTYDYSFS